MAIFSRMVAISFFVWSNISLFAARYSINLKIWAPQLPLQFTTWNTLEGNVIKTNWKGLSFWDSHTLYPVEAHSLWTHNKKWMPYSSAGTSYHPSVYDRESPPQVASRVKNTLSKRATFSCGEMEPPVWTGRTGRYALLWGRRWPEPNAYAQGCKKS